MHVTSDRIPETNSQVNASKIIVATDDTARGLVQLVDDHGVTELVMGAASDRAYTRYMQPLFFCLFVWGHTDSVLGVKPFSLLVGEPEFGKMP